MKKSKKKQRFFSSFERVMYKVCIGLILALIVLIVCSETSLAQVNLEVQKLTTEVDNQKKRLDSLNMKIDEMTSLENIKEISEEYGLTYNSDRIKTIG